MESLTISNLSTGRNLASCGIWATGFLQRLRGLLGKKEMREGHALVLTPCNMVHSIGMKFAIDVLFLDQAGEVIHLIENMTPGIISPLIKSARYVVELPIGQIARSQTMVGHRLALIPNPSPG